MALRISQVVAITALLATSPAIAQFQGNVSAPLSEALRLPVESVQSSQVSFMQQMDQTGAKSGGKAMLLSAVWPGAGEWYLGHKTRAIVMSLVEITGWTAYFVYTNKGNDIRTEFREYADTYWDEAGYRAWHEGFDENLTVEEKLQFQQDFGIAHPDMYSHTLEVEHTQQYYEMIGKYNQYTAYWEDYDPALHAPNRPGSTITPMRDHYETRRHDHNVQLKRATMAATVIFLNRLASLMDTLLLVKGRSNQDAHMRVAFDTEKCSFGSVPTAGLQLKF